jgi:uncharacterized membrane protein YbaN (DUF454 family)
MANLSLRRGLLILAGVLSVGLAVAGIFLPVLPTTPFLLLAAACFMRSSDRLYRWLTAHRWLGPYIRSYQQYRAVTRRSKVLGLLLLWVTLGYSTIWVMDALALRVVLVLIGSGVTVHLLRMRTLTPEMLAEGSRAGSVEREPYAAVMEDPRP